MTVDKSVESAIKALKLTWDNTNALKRPGFAPLWIPIDSTAKIKFSLPGKVISYLGIDKDQIGADFSQVLELEGSGSTKANNSTNRLLTNTTFNATEKQSIYRPFVVDLVKPITYSYKGANREIKKITVRFPPLASIDCINYFLYNMCPEVTRPTYFRSAGGRKYTISKLTKQQLGIVSTKYGQKVTDTKYISAT